LCPPPPTSPLFPYTTLFRSLGFIEHVEAVRPEPMCHQRDERFAVRLFVQCATVRVSDPGVLKLLDVGRHVEEAFGTEEEAGARSDRKSTRLNSSHQIISYAV